MSVSLNAYHFTELSRKHHFTQPELENVRDFGSSLGEEDVKARLVGLGDRTRYLRQLWISSWLRPVDEHVYRCDDLRSVAQAEADLDVIIVHGDDIRRLKGLVSEVRQVLLSKAIVAVVGKATSTALRPLIAAGADDVFTLAMHPREAAARLRALVRRYQVTGAIPEDDPHDPAGRIAWGQYFTPMQFQILELLLKNVGEYVPYSQILHSIGKNSSFCSRRALRVHVSKIRANLPSGMTISNESGLGYKLSGLRPSSMASHRSRASAPFLHRSL